MGPDIPTYDQLMFPVLETLKDMGGSGLRNEIIEVVIDRQRFSDEQIEQRHPKSRVPIVADRIGWALSYLKKINAVENSKRGMWALTTFGRGLNSDEEINRLLKVTQARMNVLRASRHRREVLQIPSGESDLDVDNGDDDDNGLDTYGGLDDDEGLDVDNGDDDEGDQWKDRLIQRLLKMPPYGFERLMNRILLDVGFRKVKVLEKSGDGSFEGVGVYCLSLVSFPIYFQCKRYKGSVPASVVGDFRGAMVGRGEKGLMVTTGTFTRGASEESRRDGAPTVTLINRDELCDLMKKYELGVHTRIRQVIELNSDFFEQFEIK